jgi:hypothetical protein
LSADATLVVGIFEENLLERALYNLPLSVPPGNAYHWT